MWCWAADTSLKLLDRAVSGGRFLTGGVFECDFLIIDLWQYCVCCIRSGVTRCTLLMVLYQDRMCQCGVTRSALVAHRYTYARPSYRTSQYRKTFINLSVSLGNDLADPVFAGVRLASFNSSANAFLLPKLLYHYYSFLLFFHFSSFCLYRLPLWGWGL